MKSFLSKNWRNILYIICGLVIIVNLIIIATTPATIPDQFAKYGPTISSKYNAKGNVDDVKNASKGQVDSFTNTLEENSMFTNDSARIVVIGSLAICGIMILSALLDNSSSDKKKK